MRAFPNKAVYFLFLSLAFSCTKDRTDVKPPQTQIFYEFPFQTVIPIERMNGEVCPHAGETPGDWLKNLIKSVSPVTLNEQISIGKHFHENELGFALVKGEKLDRVRGIIEKMQPFLQNQKLPHVGYVVEIGSVNAFTIPGGNIYVTTGLLEMVGNDDDQLAGVIGHELGHNENGHTRENARIIKFANTPYVGRVISGAYTYASMWFDKADELESDLAGLYLATKAGYNPEKYLKVIRQFQQWEGYPSSDWQRFLEELVRTHPWAVEREDCIKNYLDRSRKKIACGKIYKNTDALVKAEPSLFLRKYPSENAEILGKAMENELVGLVCDCESEDKSGKVKGMWAYIATDKGEVGWAMKELAGKSPKIYLEEVVRKDIGVSKNMLLLGVIILILILYWRFKDKFSR
jgi:beta-barrel assembly-enhancing protease